MAYITTAELKTYLDITSSSLDTLLGVLLDNAQSVINNYCDRDFAPSAASSKYFDADVDVDGMTLWLGDEDLASTDDLAITNGDGVAVDVSSEIAYRPRRLTPYYAIDLLPSSSKAWTGKSNGDDIDAIQVYAWWGYSKTAPENIEQALYRLASFMFRQRSSSSDVDKPLVLDTGMVLMPSEMPNDVRQMLTGYRRRSAIYW